MHTILAPFVAGFLGVALYGASLLGVLPDALSVTVYPGAIVSFVLIQGQVGGLAFVAGAVAQFLVYAFVAMVVTVLAMCLKIMGL